jgi:hypothetical protein
MPLSNAGQNAIKAGAEQYGAKKFPFQSSNPQPGSFSEPSNFPTFDNQPQTQPGASNGTADTRKPKLMEFLQSKPERDVQGEENIKRRAKINAFGRLLGSMGQLGGMASGGDAVMLEDTSTPWLKNQSMIMDNDYRNQMNQYYNRLFQTDMANNNLENQWAMRDQDRDFRREERTEDRNFRREERAEDRDFRREERSDAQSFQEKMQDKQFAQQMRQLGVRNQQDLDKMMMGVGINPRSSGAMNDFLDKMGNQFEAQNEFTKARTNWNNRPTGKGEQNQFDQEANFRKGRDLELTRLRNEYNQMINASEPNYGQDSKLRDEKLKNVYDRIKQLETLKPDMQNPLVVDLIEAGAGIGEEGIDKSIGVQQEKQNIPPDPRTGQPNAQNRTEVTQEQRQQSINSTIDQVRANKSKILSANPDYNFIQKLIDQSMQSGLFDSEEEAFNSIIELAENL